VSVVESSDVTAAAVMAAGHISCCRTDTLLWI